MAFGIEFSAEAEGDLELIFDHLFESYRNLAEAPAEALAHAARRLGGIRRAADRIAAAPHRGTLHPDILPGLRHATIDGAIYWFVVDEAAGVVRVLAVFFGGQDHRRRMLRRLLG